MSNNKNEHNAKSNENQVNKVEKQEINNTDGINFEFE